MLSYAHLLTALCGLATTSLAVNPIEVVGKDFVDSVTKERFQIIGIDYQPNGSSGFNGKADPLSDPPSCLRDAALMQRLGVNTIRVYNLAPSANHDECASIFNAAGIYMILDVNSPLGDNGALSRIDPASTYNNIYLEQVFGVMVAFKNFPNTLGFFSGNEVINEQSVIEVPAYIRAVQRDMKDYMTKHFSRSIPLGYSAADVRPVLVDTANYMTCEIANATSSISDFFALNSYSWCGNATYQTSGYDVLTEDFLNSSVPVFFSEYGCNAVMPRVFTEVQALYSPEMTAAMCGGLVYEWTEDVNNYGLVQINANNTVSLLQDYVNLQIQYNQLNLTQLESANTTQTSVTPVPCDASLISTAGFLSSFDLPARPSSIEALIENGIANPNNGQLVSVSSQTIPETVYNVDGQPITDLKLTVLSSGQANQPGLSASGTNGSSPTATGSGAAATTSSYAYNAQLSSTGLFSTFAAVVALAVSLAW